MIISMEWVVSSGSTVRLTITVGAGGADGAGYWLFPELRHALQQQKSRSKLSTAPPSMAPGVVKIQCVRKTFWDFHQVCVIVWQGHQ